jgi:hypothetical protein
MFESSNNVLILDWYVSKPFLADGLEDGLYTIQYSGCPRRYVSYARSRRYPSPVDLQDINTSNRKVVWRLKNMPGGSVSLQALERPLGASGMLSYKTSCRSRWAGVQKKGLWMMKRYVNGLIPGSSYTMVAKVLVDLICMLARLPLSQTTMHVCDAERTLV